MKDVICKVIVMQAVIVWIFCACGLSRSSNFEGRRESWYGLSYDKKLKCSINIL